MILLTISTLLITLSLLLILLYTTELIDDDGVIDLNILFRVLPHMPRHLWNTLWIRKDEFHKSLDMDMKLMMVLNKPGMERYLFNLTKRREKAHRRFVVG